MRYCLIDSGTRHLQKMHLVIDDVHPVTLCGLPASTFDRYSRRSVTVLRNKVLCLNCERARG